MEVALDPMIFWRKAIQKLDIAARPANCLIFGSNRRWHGKT
jgi:hypothetical protein